MSDLMTPEEVLEFWGIDPDDRILCDLRDVKKITNVKQAEVEIDDLLHEMGDERQFLSAVEIDERLSALKSRIRELQQLNE